MELRMCMCGVQEHVYSRGMDAKCSSAAAGGAASGDSLGLSKVTAAGAAFATTSMEKISSAARYTSQATASGMNSLNERYQGTCSFRIAICVSMNIVKMEWTRCVCVYVCVCVHVCA